MTINKNNQFPKFSSGVHSRHKFLLLSVFVLTIIILGTSVQTANAQKKCSNLPGPCTSVDQTPFFPGNYPMFNEADFRVIKDGFGRPRKFYVHIPESYDTLNAEQKMPVIFAFHGGGGTPEKMIQGKWGERFDEDIAYVIPAGEADPCDPTEEKAWMGVGVGPAVVPHDPLVSRANCHPSTQRPKYDAAGNPVMDAAGNHIYVTFWDATLPGSFTDVLFIEELRQMVLDSFPKLNPAKVYATGFSSGGNMTNHLLCYRSELFRGFSVVSKTIYGKNGRADFLDDGIDQTDPNSLVATCGKTQNTTGHAKGIISPQLWGETVLYQPGPFGSVIGYKKRNTEPYVLFAGDQDTNFTVADIEATGAEIRGRNNLTGLAANFNPFMDIKHDDAQTQLYLFNTRDNSGFPAAAAPYSAYARYLAKSVDDGSPTFYNAAGHGMPDVDICPSAGGKMTCDYNYTDRTLSFFQSYAELNLNP